jgi:hypothetical protein
VRVILPMRSYGKNKPERGAEVPPAPPVQAVQSGPQSAPQEPVFPPQQWSAEVTAEVQYSLLDRHFPEQQQEEPEPEPVPSQSDLRRRQRILGIEKPKVRRSSHAAPEVPEGGVTERQEPRGLRVVAFGTAVAAFGVLLIAALLYWFGWVRDSALADGLGIDGSVLGRSAGDYVPSSLSSLYLPLLALAGLLLFGRFVHPRLLLVLRRHRKLATFVCIHLRAGCVLVPLSAWSAANDWPSQWPGQWKLWWGLLLPLGITLGVLVTAYGVLLGRQVNSHRRIAGLGVRAGSPTTVLTSAVLLLCMVWTLGSYANAQGRAEAAATLLHPESRAAVLLYSTEDLRLGAEQGVVAEPSQAAGYRFRYTGMRLLRQADQRLYLLTVGSGMKDARLVVVRDDPRIRVEYARSAK